MLNSIPPTEKSSQPQKTPEEIKKEQTDYALSYLRMLTASDAKRLKLNWNTVRKIKDGKTVSLRGRTLAKLSRKDG
jgi:hypothetical protein